jgi:hypothetical protein
MGYTYTNVPESELLPSSMTAADARTALGINDITITTDATDTRTLSAADDRCIINMTHATGSTVTMPTGLGVNFACIIRMGGAGPVTIAAGAGATGYSADACWVLRVQYEEALIHAITDSTFAGVGPLVA